MGYTLDKEITKSELHLWDDCLETQKNRSEEIQNCSRIIEKGKNEEVIEYLASLIENVSDIIISADLKKITRSWNHAAELILGWSPEEVLGKSIIDFLQVQAVGISDPEALNIIKQNGQIEIEVICKNKNGNMLNMFCKVSALRDAKGNLTGFVGIMHDITNQKRAKNLANAMEHIRNLIHSTLDFNKLMSSVIMEASKAIGSKNAAVSIHEGNKWTVNYIYGFSGDIIGLCSDDDHEPHAVLAVQTRKPVIIYDTLTDDRVNCEYMKKWGVRSVLVVPLLAEEEAIGVIFFNYYDQVFKFHECDIEFAENLASSVSMALKNVKLYEEVSTELSRRRQYELILKSQSEFLSKVIDTLDLSVFRLNYPDLTIKSINQKGYNIIKGLRPDINSAGAVIGQVYCELIPGYSREFILDHIKSIIDNKKTSFSKDKKLLINGEEMFVNMLYQPILNSSGEIDEIIAIAIDVTNEVKTNIKMEKALKVQEEFFSNISHELKTPLNIIYAAVQLFDMYCSNGSLDEKKYSIIKYINSIKHNSYRLSKLINNIVDSSKIEAGFFELNISNNNIVEVVEEIVLSVADYIDSKGLNIVFDTDVEEKIIACDPEKIERIVLNLISNAIKFSDHGGEILVCIHDKNEFVEISVRDNGIGIEKSHLGMIFDRYKQVDKSLSRNAEGTGIGLSLVKSIVELHSGNIHVESQLGKGSKFIVLLPTAKAMHENILVNNRLRSKTENIQVELSDI